ncbi:MAG: ABC transporter permease [Bryobacterales bacterium]|nr:ABC transporter permease [Bryobacterales bacterium]
MSSVWQDLAYGWRGMRRQPAFAALAILTLAFGIGAATSIFSVIYGVLLYPFPYKDADRIVHVQVRDLARPSDDNRIYLQTGEFLDYAARAHVFSDVIGAAYEDVLYFNGTGMEQFAGAIVTPNTFRFLGVPPLLGRGLTEADAKPGASPVFAMSYDTWSKRFDKDPSILGRTFVLNSVPATLVGIMSRRFNDRAADVWRTEALSPADPRLTRRFWLFRAKLKPGVSAGQAEAELQVISRPVARTYPALYPKSFSVQVVRLADASVRRARVKLYRTKIYTIAGAVGLLLLIACGNVANMLLARATAREKEMAIRCSVGAGRWQIVRLLLIESLLLALGGTAIGGLYAFGCIAAMDALLPPGVVPREAVIELNLPVLLFSLGTAIVTTFLFGLAPALQTARRDFVEPLRDSGKGMSGGFRRARLRNALVVAEVAFSLVLLSTAGLLMRSFVALESMNLGFNPENIVVARLPLPRGEYQEAGKKTRFFRSVVDRLQSLPGVVAASETTSIPLYGGIDTEIDIPGRTHSESWQAILQLCSEGYFRTVGLRLLRGRLLTELDVNQARHVAVINETFVSKYFGGENPIGRPVRLTRLQTGLDGSVDNPEFEVVGVVADAVNQGVQEPIASELWVPFTVTAAFERGVLVRTAGNPAAFVRTLRSEVWALDPNVAVTFAGPLTEFMKKFTFAAPRFTLIFLVVFAVMGLALVLIGIYSTLAYTISRQTQEIGIRMALGARNADVLKMVFGMGMRLIGLGIAAGLVISAVVLRVLRSELWNLSPFDPLTMAAVVLLVLVAGMAACWIPARRAVRVHPMAALRYQ